MNSSRVLHEWATLAGFETSAGEDGTIHSWTDGSTILAVRSEHPGFLVTRENAKGLKTVGHFEHIVDAESAVLVSFGAAASEIRRQIKEWKLSQLAAPVEKVSGGYTVTIGSRSALLSSVADARNLAAYALIRRDSGFPDDRLLTSTFLPEAFRRSVPPSGWTEDDVKRAFDTIPINATMPPQYKLDVPMTLLANDQIPLSLATWLIDNGANVNFSNSIGQTPLLKQAVRPELVKLLLERGASPDSSGKDYNAPIIRAARAIAPESIRLLLDAGANSNVVDLVGNWTLLDLIAFGADESNALDALEAVRLVFTTTEQRKPAPRAVNALQESYLRVQAVHRRSRDGELRFRERADQALAAFNELLPLLSVEIPHLVARRVLAPGEHITVSATDSDDRYRELWKLLVPGSGAAESVQGEVIRIIGRVGHEILNNGGGNWASDFEQMLDAFVSFTQTGTPLPPAEQRIVEISRARLRNGAFSKQSIDDLTDASVTWVLLNTLPVPLPKPAYRR